MAPQSDVVFLFDVDNTLLDNDRAEADLGDRLAAEFGAEGRDRFYALYEEQRDVAGHADFMGAFHRYWHEISCDQRLLRISTWFLDYPFVERVYPGALDVLARVGRWGPVVILTDGDVVFQPRKVQRAGLWAAAGGRVLVYVRKVDRLDEVEGLYLARHYVAVEDKPSLLAAMKDAWGERVTTVWARQGHYAREAEGSADAARVDIAVDRIAALADYSLEQLLGEAREGG